MIKTICFLSIKNKCSIFYIFLLFPLFVNAQPKDSVNMVNQMVIGNDSSKPIEYSLGNPVDVTVGTNGDIFVADQGTMSIKVFDKDGNYLRSIGRRGRGPGEFLSFKEVSINDKNELIIADSQQFRVTKLSTLGNVLNTFSIRDKNQAIAYFSQITPLPNGKHLILYKLGNPGNNNDKIFHIWDSQFSESSQEFGSFNEIDFQNKFGMIAGLIGGVGSFYLNKTNDIIFAPSIYQGNVFKYRKEKEGWSSTDKTEGHNLPFSSTELYANNLSRDELIERGARQIFTPQGKFQGNIRITSAGLFGLANGNTVNFVFIKKQSGQDKGKWELGAEIYDDELNYKGFFSLRTFNQVDNRGELAIKAKDKNDHFYMISRENDISVVRVFTLDIQEK